MLNRHDPQIWAQYTMLAAMLAVLMLVVIALPVAFLSVSDDDDMIRKRAEEDEEIESEDRSDVCRKGTLIAVLVLHRIAAACLYIAVAMLIAALFMMEPDPLNT